MRNRFRQTCATILAFLLFISVYFHPHMTLAESSEDGMYDTYDNIQVWDQAGSGNGLWSLMTSSAYHNPGLYDREAIVHSETGKQLADAIMFADTFNGTSDPALKEALNAMGLIYEVNTTGGQRWLLFAPQQTDVALLPVVQVFTPASLYGMSMYYRLIQLAAQGDFLLVLLGIENGNLVSLVPEIVNLLAERYPVDLSRVYSVGHSHYGAFAQQLAREYPDRIAGIAQLSGYFGCMNRASQESSIEAWHRMDMPLINFVGYAEMNSPVPMNTDAPSLETIPERYQQLFPMFKADRIKTWQDRLYELGCEVLTYEEIEAAADGTAVEKVLGFPVAHDEIIQSGGLTYYIGDLVNTQGNNHARFVVIDNFPHATSSYELELTWEFLRRFARNTETGACEELY